MCVVKMLDVKIQPPENPVEVIADSTRAATFILHDEDHTIGNLLCDVLSEHPLVDYVGYSIVHPTQPKIQVRIQTRGLLCLNCNLSSFHSFLHSLLFCLFLMI